VAQAERDRVIARIAELKSMLRLAQSNDLREALTLAISDCEERLAELEADPAQGPHSAIA
jgi:hypothetical protein